MGYSDILCGGGGGVFNLLFKGRKACGLPEGQDAKTSCPPRLDLEAAGREIWGGQNRPPLTSLMSRVLFSLWNFLNEKFHRAPPLICLSPRFDLRTK